MLAPAWSLFLSSIFAGRRGGRRTNWCRSPRRLRLRLCLATLVSHAAMYFPGPFPPCHASVWQYGSRASLGSSPDVGVQDDSSRSISMHAPHKGWACNVPCAPLRQCCRICPILFRAAIQSLSSKDSTLSARRLPLTVISSACPSPTPLRSSLPTHPSPSLPPPLNSAAPDTPPTRGQTSPPARASPGCKRGSS